MGYMLSSVGNLPIDDDISLYIFVVNGEWRGDPYDQLERNFAAIAKNIGPNAVIVKGFDPTAWTSQVAKTYFGDGAGELLQALPALLLTDARPGQLTANSLRLIVPLREVMGRFLDWDDFYRSLSDFALNKNPEFLRRFKDRGTIEAANAILDLRPNFFGIGINLNAVYERWFRK